MHRSRKPVRKCHGCGLNLRDRCGVYQNPHEMWHGHRHCPGYKNAKMLAEYEARMEHVHVKAAKERRRATARQRRAEPHHNGDQHVIYDAGARAS